MEFVVPACDAEAFYPIEISFNTSQTLCDVAVDTVTSTQTGAPVKYGQKRGLNTAAYQVV